MTAPRLDASAADIARAMSDMCKTRPRSLARMFGSNGPTDSQRAAYDASVRAWNKEYRALSKAHRVSLVRDNAAFAASRKLDAETLAARMNARPLGPDTDGGEWSVYVPGAMVEQCEACGCHLLGDAVVSAGNTLLFLCLPCALADCERAEADAAARVLPILSIVTAYEVAEWGRCAQAMYARGRNDLGHMLSVRAARSYLSAAEYDEAANAYRAWLTFDQPKGA